MTLDRAEALRAAEETAGATARELGAWLHAVILHGSLVLGDYVPGRSDIDLLAVVAEPLTEPEVATLSAFPVPAPVDLRVIARQAAAEPSRLPLMDAYLALAPDREPRIERRVRERDLVVELSVCRAHGRSVVGAEATELIGEVPEQWVLQVGDAQLADWQAIGDDPPYAQLTVLTACRVWRFAEEGAYCAKAAAAEWALERDPSLEAIREALRQRHDDPDAAIDPKEVQRVLEVVRERISVGVHGAPLHPAGDGDDLPRYVP
jgi:predicted nucleotidyltransferase